MLQPNFLATHYKTHYERIRDEKVKRNNEVLESLGVMKLATSMMGSARLRCANANGKRGRADQVDDPDYMLSDDEDGHGYNSECDDSFEQEDIEIPLGGLPAQSHTEPQCGATLFSERVTRSTPHPSMESQASLPPIAQPQNEELPENNGADCIRTDQYNRVANSRLQLQPAAITGQHKAHCDSKTATAVCTISRAEAAADKINRPTRGPTQGIQAQRLIDKKGKLPVPIPQLFRAPVGKHAAQLASRIGVEDKFDLQGDPIDVEKAVATQCGQRMSNHNFALHKKYKKLKETRGEEYARNNPPAGVNPEQWTSLVTKKWTVPKWLDKMVQIETEHNAQEGAIPITQEELSVKGLKARSGYVKGLGIRPSSFIRTVKGEYVTHLEGKVQEQAKKIQDQAEKIQEQAEGIEAANNKIEELALAKQEQGKTLASVMVFLKQQGFTG
ncbi:hypothetical protein RHMOL_Rhmol02G0290200 [Rhododendron molle]|uniref:Uncharacterized protein n=1 Tax=Rhododendron molle TaxID=49168 RepID=A0ACC0PV21_RHOML|nr:hypothetical protein RHMOL_Rhmol02G0290200 [Rhododendron molle]